MTEKDKDWPTRLPDVITSPDPDGSEIVVANAKARRILNRGFEKAGPPWAMVRTPDGAFACRRSIGLLRSERGPGLLCHALDGSRCRL